MNSKYTKKNTPKWITKGSNLELIFHVFSDLGTLGDPWLILTSKSRPGIDLDPI